MQFPPETEISYHKSEIEARNFRSISDNLSDASDPRIQDEAENGGKYIAVTAREHFFSGNILIKD